MRPYLKKKKSQKRASGVAQGVVPEFKPQYHTHKKIPDCENSWIIFSDPRII
jgi:hypothetical protein